MIRKSMKINGLNISFLDNEEEGQTLICLHGHYGTASMFKFLDNHYNGRLILLDQRGHGFSDHAKFYGRNDYLNDLKSFIETLEIKMPIILGHSLGGVNAFQYCSKYKNVSKLIIEDIGTEIHSHDNIFNTFPKEFDSIWEVNNEFVKKNLQLSTYFMESLYYNGIKWRFRFDYDEIANSLNCMIGNYWNDWGKINCPILLLHGTKSWACRTENIIEMSSRNRNVTLKMYKNAGHEIHDDNREEFIADVLDFINKS